jgi:hypothetical protein
MELYYSVEMVRHDDHLIKHNVGIVIRQLKPASLNDLAEWARRDSLVPDPAK